MQYADHGRILAAEGVCETIEGPKEQHNGGISDFECDCAQEGVDRCNMLITGEFWPQSVFVRPSGGCSGKGPNGSVAGGKAWLQWCL